MKLHQAFIEIGFLVLLTNKAKFTRHNCDCIPEFRLIFSDIGRCDVGKMLTNFVKEIMVNASTVFQIKLFFDQK